MEPGGKLREFGRRIKRIYRLAPRESGSFSRPDKGLPDLRPAELEAMFDTFLGQGYDPVKRRQVSEIQSRLHKAQENLAERLSTGELPAQKYVYELNQSLAYAFFTCERILGTGDFERLFGVSAREAIGLVDESAFLKQNPGR